MSDAGDLTPRVFSADAAHPRARNRDAVVQACKDVAGATSQVIAAGRIPVLMGGDCSITAGAVTGCLAHYPDTGLLYLDGDADLRTPQTTMAGNFDGMVIAALLGEGDPGYAGLAGTVPMLPPERLAILGYDDSDIRPARTAPARPAHQPHRRQASGRRSRWRGRGRPCARRSRRRCDSGALRCRRRGFG